MINLSAERRADVDGLSYRVTVEDGWLNLTRNSSHVSIPLKDVEGVIQLIRETVREYREAKEKL